METTMRKIYRATPILLLTFLMVFAFGCSEKSGTNTDGVNTGVGNVQIVTGTDTLRYLPGDSASTPVVVIVTDMAGNVMQGEKVAVALANPLIGILEFVDTGLRDTTNALGRVDLVYRSYATPGKNYITAAASGRTAIDSIVVEPANVVVSQLMLQVNPEQVFASAVSEDSASVTVTLIDDTHAGIEGVSLSLSATQGHFIPLPPTNSAGSATTTWYIGPPEGTAYVTAQAGGLTAQDSVQIIAIPDVSGTLTLTADSYVGTANNCVVPILLTAILRDQDGVGIAGDTIRFGIVGFGQVDSSEVVTNGSGVATNIFCDLGAQSIDDSVYVIAIHDGFAIRDTIGIWIDEAFAVDTVILHLANNFGTACKDSSRMQLTVLYENGTPVTGLGVTYHTNCGGFTWPDTTLLDGGVADNYYYFCDQTNLPQIEVYAEVEGVQSNIEQIFTQPDNANHFGAIGYGANPIEIGDTTTIAVLVVDSCNNPVFAGQAVVCSTSLGTVNPRIAQTDSFGVARTLLNSGTASGQANVRMHLVGLDVDSVIISVLSNMPSAIYLAVDNPAPQVWGTGGNSTTTLRATVVDANGNPVQDGVRVGFCILPGNPGGGVNINGVGLCDSASTAGGLAVATLNAGTRPGPVSVRACTRVDGVDICASSDIINIVAGPPKNISIGADLIGTDIGGGAWQLEMTAVVQDTFNNPVRDGTAVYFAVDPDTAQVTSDSVFVGNPNDAGDTFDGVAFNYLNYNSEATNEVVFITARTGGSSPVTETIELTLPIQTPTIELTIGHGAEWHFPTDGDPCRISCTALVTDGHDVEINKQQVDYYIQRGSLWTVCPGSGGTERSWATTGPLGDPSGQPEGTAFLCMRDLATNIFPDPLTPEITGDVTVEVHGFTAATDSRLILFRRGQGLNDPPPEPEIGAAR